MKLNQYEFWFICGTQLLYGKEVIHQEEEHCRIMTEALNGDERIVGKVVFKTSNSHFYGCVAITGLKWKQLDN